MRIKEIEGRKSIQFDKGGLHPVLEFTLATNYPMRFSFYPGEDIKNIVCAHAQKIAIDEGLRTIDCIIPKAVILHTLEDYSAICLDCVKDGEKELDK